MAFFGGKNYPSNQIVGMGLYGAVTADDLDRVEHFFRSRDVPSTIVVSPLSDMSLPALLGERGYRIAEFNSVLIRRIRRGGALRPRPRESSSNCVTRARTRRAMDPRARPRASPRRVAVAEEVFGGFAALPGALAFLARIDGEAVGRVRLAASGRKLQSGAKAGGRKAVRERRPQNERSQQNEIPQRNPEPGRGPNRKGGPQEMNRKNGFDCELCCAFLLLALAGFSGLAAAQSSTEGKSCSSASTTALEKEFFGAIREGDTKKFLSYVPQDGVNFGPRSQHLTRDDVEQQLLSHHGIYCKLFDSSCMLDAAINLENSGRACSYRELLTRSEKVNTAASEITRGGVRQAVLVARNSENDQCARILD